MDERGANIDLIFRNGLKDYEVLPPQEVWDNIHPVVIRKRRPFIILRAAALITVVLSMSFFAYRWSMEMSTRLDSSAVMAFNNATVSPISSFDLVVPPALTLKEINSARVPEKVLTEISRDIVLSTSDVNNSAPGLAYLKETKSLYTGETQLLRGPRLKSMNSSIKNSFNIKEYEQQYFPDNNSIKSTDRWSIAAMASPTYYSRFNSGNDEFSKQLMASEQPLVSYSGGVALSYKVNKRLSIQSGLYYSTVGEQVDDINSFIGFETYGKAKGAGPNFEVLTSNGNVHTNNADIFLSSSGPVEKVLTNFTNDVFDPKKANLQYLNNSLLQNFSYLELPIVLRYKLIDKKIDFNIIGGMSYNMLVGNSVYTLIEGSKYPIGDTEGLKLLTVSSSLGMGMEYNFSDKLSLNLEPTFKYFFGTFNRREGSTTPPHSFGIFSGVTYKF
jgi:hypothetical protein